MTNNFDMEVPGLDEPGYGRPGGEGKVGCKRRTIVLTVPVDQISKN